MVCLKKHMKSFLKNSLISFTTLGGTEIAINSIYPPNTHFQSAWPLLMEVNIFPYMYWFHIYVLVVLHIYVLVVLLLWFASGHWSTEVTWHSFKKPPQTREGWGFLYGHLLFGNTTSRPTPALHISLSHVPMVPTECYVFRCSFLMMFSEGR